MKKKYIMVMISICLISTGCRHLADANETIYQETKASTLLERYERFKDMYSNLNSKLATISVLESKIDSLEADYEGVPKSEWQRVDSQTLSQWRSEIDALKASYNNLAAQYNADMSKANYRYTNVGDLPKGATEPLPRQVAPFIKK